jgi:hypothetical protein
MTLEEVNRVKNISPDAFVANYVKTQKPIIIEQISHSWPAYQKWNLDYIKSKAGHKIVPLYDNRPVSHLDKFNGAHTRMKLGNYIDLLCNESTSYRMFLYNLLQEIPDLQDDFYWPDLNLRLIKQLPMLFFGGENSKVFMHFDIDYANILHFHFHGTKRCLLFSPEETPFLYKVPHALIANEKIDFTDPDYTQWPALEYAHGYTATLNHGEMLYIPEGYWHQMTYITAGFSMSLRALPKKNSHRLNALYNLLVMRNYDNFMRWLYQDKWITYKNEKSIIETHRKLGIR